MSEQTALYGWLGQIEYFCIDNLHTRFETELNGWDKSYRKIGDIHNQGWNIFVAGLHISPVGSISGSD